MVYLVLFIMLAWVSTSLWLTYRTGKELTEQGFKPWAKGWYWKSLWRLLPEPEQKVYGKYNRHQGLLIACVVLVFVFIAVFDAGPR